MNRLALLVAVSALVALGDARPAAAAGYVRPSGPPVNDPQVRLWLNNAARHFGRVPPCPHGLTVDLYERRSKPTTMAAAPIGGCDLSLDPDYYPRPAEADADYWNALLCTVVAHEYGHLVGLRHSRRRGSLMFRRVDRPRRLCRSPRPGRFQLAVNAPDAWRPPPPRLLAVNACPDALGVPRPLAFGACPDQ